jgi:hypothetical protein
MFIPELLNIQASFTGLSSGLRVERTEEYKKNIGAVVAITLCHEREGDEM